MAWYARVLRMEESNPCNAQLREKHYFLNDRAISQRTYEKALVHTNWMTSTPQFTWTGNERVACLHTQQPNTLLAITDIMGNAVQELHAHLSAVPRRISSKRMREALRE